MSQKYTKWSFYVLSPFFKNFFFSFLQNLPIKVWIYSKLQSIQSVKEFKWLIFTSSFWWHKFCEKLLQDLEKMHWKMCYCFPKHKALNCLMTLSHIATINLSFSSLKISSQSFLVTLHDWWSFKWKRGERKTFLILSQVQIHSESNDCSFLPLSFLGFSQLYRTQ